MIVPNRATPEPYLIIELANAHGGSAQLIRSTISQFSAIDYRRKGIKFQIFAPETIALPDYEWFAVYEALYFSQEVWKTLIIEASACGDVWIDVFDIYGVNVISENLNLIFGIKLQASVVQNEEVFQALSQLSLQEKFVIINIAGYELNDIYALVEKFYALSQNLILQIGFQSYPTPVESTGLQKIAILRSAFPYIPICMADHVDAATDIATQLPLYAYLLGCHYIEKHFCLNRKDAVYDSYSALEPSEMQRMCSSIKQLLMAQRGAFIHDLEGNYLENSIQRPILKHEVLAGSLVSYEDVLYRRTSQEGLTTLEINHVQQRHMILDVTQAAGKTISSRSFRKANIAIIVAARMKSTRLARKALLPIAGVASIRRCLLQCHGVAGVQEVILATSDLPEDAILKEHVIDGATKFWQGDPEDVVSRYLGGCKFYDVDVVLRVTGDCPLVLPEIAEYLLDKHFEAGADYTAAKDFAVGSSFEIFNVTALQEIANHFKTAEFSEYMTWYFQNNPDCFKLNIVDLPPELVRNYRLTLDYSDDLKMFEVLFNKLDSEQDFYTAGSVFSVLDANPEIAEINKNCTLRYKEDRSLIDELNKKTRINLSKVELYDAACT